MANQTMLERHLAEHIAMLTYQHLMRSDLVRDETPTMMDTTEPLMYVWTRTDRVVLIVNPLRIKNLDALIKPRFQHHLATVLQGRRVVVTNHRGIFVQVGYYPETKRELQSRPLDLSEQLSPLHVPIGMTANGPLWLSLVEMDAVLIGGARRMGKTNLLHGWIAALSQGNAVRLILFDGKGGVEFARYANHARCQIITEVIASVIGELFAEMNKRFDILKQAGVPNLAEYNQGRGEGARLERIVLIIDELAYVLQEDVVEDVIVDVIARGGAVGIHPVLATQRPSSNVITPRLKGNLVTRIALPVPSRADSMVILDRTGAESITKTPGRLLIAHSARLIEAQAFDATSALTAPITHNDGSYARTKSLMGPQLSDREMCLAQAALEQEGRFLIRDIAEATGETLEYVNNVAKKWELRGWLTEVKRNERGHKIGREMTPALRQLLPN